MTIHHDLALGLSALLVLACMVVLLLRGQLTPEMVSFAKDVIGFSSQIVIATFAHAQGVKSGTAAALRMNGNGHGDGAK